MVNIATLSNAALSSDLSIMQGQHTSKSNRDIVLFTCQDTLSSVSDTASTRTDFGGPEGTDGGQKVKELYITDEGH